MILVIIYIKMCSYFTTSLSCISAPLHTLSSKGTTQVSGAACLCYPRRCVWCTSVSPKAPVI